MKQENNAGGRPGLIGRRGLIAMVGGAAVAWPLAARAQERALPLIGFLYGGAADRSTGFRVGIPRGLNEMGFVEGRNFAAEYRWADDHLDRLPALAADLVQRRVAVIVTGGGPQPALAAKAATSTIPIVFFAGDDPVKFGLVPRYNRPGSNLTGFNFMISQLEQKRVGLLHELVPTAGVVAALCDPHGSGAAAILAEVAGAAKSLGLELVTVNASDPAQFDAAFAQAEHAGAGAMLVTAVELFTVSRANRDRLVELAAKHRLPAMFSLSERPKPADSSATAPIRWTVTARWASMSAASSRVRIPVTCRPCGRPNSRSPSTSRPRRRWASPCPLRSSPWPTR